MTAEPRLLLALRAPLEAESRGSRSGQLCLYIYTLQMSSEVDLLTSVCTAHTAQNSLSGLGVASHCLVGKENILVYCFKCQGEVVLVLLRNSMSS